MKRPTHPPAAGGDREFEAPVMAAPVSKQEMEARVTEEGENEAPEATRHQRREVVTKARHPHQAKNVRPSSPSYTYHAG